MTHPHPNIEPSKALYSSKKNFALGLKIFSTNIDLLDDVKALQPGGPFSYIEIYVVPGSYKLYSDHFHNFNLPIIIHASHCAHGVNLANEDRKTSNFAILEDSFQFAKLLNAKWIIVHGGFSGSVDQVIFQLRQLNNIKLIIENTPIFNLVGAKCTACTPEEIEKIISSSAVGGFVLDIGHSICSANTLSYPIYKFIKQFLSIKPVMYHLSDGDIKSCEDMHLNIGKGNFDITKILQLIPKDSLITLETPRSPETGIADSINDALTIQRLSESL